MTTSVKLTSSGLVKMTDGTETIIIDVDNTYATTSDIVAATSDATSVSTNADAATSDATSASTNADAATSDATSASTNADAATSTATLASTNAFAATLTATSASTNAFAATSTASDAQSTANAASTTASDAQSTAAVATSTATSALNLIIAIDFDVAAGAIEDIGVIPSETLIIIVRNNGPEFKLRGNQPATVNLIKGTSSTDDDTTIGCRSNGWTLFVRVSSNPLHFRHMIYVHENRFRTY